MKDDLDYYCKNAVEWSLIGILVFLLAAHIFPQSIRLNEEISFGLYHNNLPCFLIMGFMGLVALFLSYRLHTREYYVFSYPLSWVIPFLGVVVFSNIFSQVHNIAALFMMTLAFFMTCFLLSRSDFAWVVKYKLALVLLMLPMGFLSFGILEKVLILESVASIWSINRFAL